MIGIKLILHRDEVKFCSGPLSNLSLTATSRSLTMTWNNSHSYTEERHGQFVAYLIKCCSEGRCASVLDLESHTQATLDELLPFTMYNCCVSLQTTLANTTEVCQQKLTPEDGTIHYKMCQIIMGLTSCINFQFQRFHQRMCPLIPAAHTAY